MIDNEQELTEEEWFEQISRVPEGDTHICSCCGKPATHRVSGWGKVNYVCDESWAAYVEGYR